MSRVLCLQAADDSTSATLQLRVQQLELQQATLEAELQMERRARQHAEQALQVLQAQSVAA